MSFINTLMSGEQGLFKSSSLTPMQRITLRFVVVGLLYYGLAALEGMLMRIYQVSINFYPGFCILKHFLNFSLEMVRDRHQKPPGQLLFL